MTSKFLSFISRHKSYETFHISDWFPTLVHLATGSADLPFDVDGVNQHNMLFCHQESCSSARDDFVYNLVEGPRGRIIGAIRKGAYKLERSPFKDMLYNVVEDESEEVDLSDTESEILKDLQEYFEMKAKTIVQADNPPTVDIDLTIDDERNVITNWCDSF